MSSNAAFQRGVGPLLQLLLPGKEAAVQSFKPERALQKRIEVLAERSTEGILTAEDREEYEGYVRANKFVAILRREASLLQHACAVTEAIKTQVRNRAGQRCEYCQLRQSDSPLAVLHVEHIIRRKHSGSDEISKRVQNHLITHHIHLITHD